MENNNNNKRIRLMAEGRIGEALFKLSAPAVIGMMVMAIYNIADTFFVSLLRDTTAVAATGIVFPIFQLIGSIGLTFGIGAASVISRKLGENDYDSQPDCCNCTVYGNRLWNSIFGGRFVSHKTTSDHLWRHGYYPPGRNVIWTYYCQRLFFSDYKHGAE